MEPGFEIGQKVRKVGGTYQAYGTIIGWCTTSTNQLLYVFEFDGFPGLCHIFRPEQIINDDPRFS